MLVRLDTLLVAATVVAAAAVEITPTTTTITTTSSSSSAPNVPSLDVPACSTGKKGTIIYNKSVPNRTAFPKTQVDLCYDTQAIRIDFTAYEETNYFFNKTYKTNDPIYQYEVMEAFIYRGTNDPQTYLEFEVAPNNVTFNAFIYNPSKVRASGAPFDTFFIQQPIVDGLVSQTTLNRPAKTWVSKVRVPLGLFNVDDGQAKGTRWRMNFFRTVVAPATFPDQLLGAWNPPDAPNFHKTPFFGNICFV